MSSRLATDAAVTRAYLALLAEAEMLEPRPRHTGPAGSLRLDRARVDIDAPADRPRAVRARRARGD